MNEFTRAINPDPVYVLRSYSSGGYEQYEGVFTSLHRAKCAAVKRNWPPGTPIKWRKIRNSRTWDGGEFGIHETFLNKEIA